MNFLTIKTIINNSSLYKQHLDYYYNIFHIIAEKKIATKYLFLWLCQWEGNFNLIKFLNGYVILWKIQHLEILIWEMDKKNK